MKKHEKSKKKEALPQPEPFTPGITKGMVRDYAFRMFADKLEHDSLSLDNWIIAEKELVKSRQMEEVM